MKIVVTGALGHIGSKLIRHLPTVFRNATIVMVDNLATQRYGSLFALPEASYEFHELDLTKADVTSLIKNADVVIHLAAITDAAGTADKPDLVLKNNLAATEKVAKACLDLKVPLIFPSSTSVYGSQSEFVDESCTDLSPQSPYADCKIKEEKLLQQLVGQGLKTVVCRLGTIYGTSPGMRFHTAVNKFCWQAAMKTPITVWRTALNQKRPYLSLDDAVSAIATIIEKQIYTGEIYNILSGNHTVADVLAAIQTEIPDITITHVDHQIMNQLSYEVSVNKFKKTGFTFKGSLQQGVSETIQLLKKANEGAA